MSLIDRTATALRGAGKQSWAPVAPEIEAKLAEASARLQELEKQHGDVALEQVLGVPGGDAKLQKLVSEIATARQSVEKLRSAHAAALERDATSLRAERAALYKTQLNAVKANLAVSDSAAEALSQAATEAVKQFRIMVEKRAKAFAANPIGGEWPDGGIAHVNELKRLVAQELFRLDGRDTTFGDQHSFPGAAAQDHDKLGTPGEVDKLVDVLKQNSAYVISTLMGRKVS